MCVMGYTQKTVCNQSLLHTEFKDIFAELIEISILLLNYKLWYW